MAQTSGVDTNFSFFWENSEECVDCPLTGGVTLPAPRMGWIW